jgi:phosphatidylserine decarboxylase precursor
MKKMRFYLAIIILAGMILSLVVHYAVDRHKPITRELINLIEERPEVGEMLKRSIAEAKRVNPDPRTNPVQSLEDYFNFIDRTSQMLPQDVLENAPLATLFDQIDQGLDYFHFLVNQPLPELDNKGLFKNTLQFYPPFSSWFRKFYRTWGAFLNTEESWNEKIYQRFYDDPRFGLQKGWYESPANWKTFNQFFARRLSSPDVRPIASPDDPAVVVSPADSVPQGIWAIDENSNIKVENGLGVKRATYYSIKDLLGRDSKYRDAFAGGVLTHTFLNIHDYHRYHFAVGGKVKEKRIIEQNVADMNLWDPKQSEYIDLTSLAGWQFSQTRGYVIVDTGKYGLVALIPVGMAAVSSVNFEDNVKVGTTHKKGDPLGYFLFGGSDIIMLFQEKAGFEITAPREYEEVYKHLLMGEKYGVMRGQSR